MSDHKKDTGSMAGIQKILWYIVIIWFASVSCLFLFNHELALMLSQWGVIGIVLFTLIRVIALSEIFRKTNRTRYSLFSYLLLIIIILTIATKAFW